MTSTHAHKPPVASADDAEHNDARDEYIDDLLQRAKTVADQNAILRARAPARIHEAMAATRAAGLKNDANDNPLTQYHVVQRFLQEKAFYPPHDKRKESPAYAKIHKLMTITEDQPCLVCGVRHSTLGDPAHNPFGAVQLETHHHTIEWALANAIVPDLFNNHVRPGLLRRAQQRQTAGHVDPIYTEFDALYPNPMTADQIKAWVDHAADNLWVLCDVHHRHKFVGIHAITYPIWGPQDLVDATIVDDEIKAASAEIQKDRRAGHNGGPAQAAAHDHPPHPHHAAAHGHHARTGR
jgi:hypothetical protein